MVEEIFICYLLQVRRLQHIQWVGDLSSVLLWLRNGKLSAPEYTPQRCSAEIGSLQFLVDDTALEAEIIFERIGIQHRKRCADLVRGAGSIIDLLS